MRYEVGIAEIELNKIEKEFDVLQSGIDKLLSKRPGLVFYSNPSYGVRMGDTPPDFDFIFDMHVGDVKDGDGVVIFSIEDMGGYSLFDAIDAHYNLNFEGFISEPSEFPKDSAALTKMFNAYQIVSLYEELDNDEKSTFAHWFPEVMETVIKK